MKREKRYLRVTFDEGVIGLLQHLALEEVLDLGNESVEVVFALFQTDVISVSLHCFLLLILPIARL